MGIFSGPQTLREMFPNAPQALNTTGVVQRIWGYQPWSIINGVSGCIHHSCSTVPRNVHDVVKVNFTGWSCTNIFPLNCVTSDFAREVASQCGIWTLNPRIAWPLHFA